MTIRAFFAGLIASLAVFAAAAPLYASNTVPATPDTVVADGVDDDDYKPGKNPTNGPRRG